MKRVLACAVSASLLASAVSAQMLTLDQVTSLHSAGIDDDALIAKIKSSGTHYDLTPDQMIQLKKNGVSGPVMAALMSSESGAPKFSVDSPDPMVPHPSGVYLLSGMNGASMQRIDPTVSDQAKTGGIWGYALTGGIASMSVKASIQNEHARSLSATQTPTFYMFFDESNPGTPASSVWQGNQAVVSSPGEFSLVRFTEKQGHREARVGSMNIGGAKSGVMDKDRIAFDYQVVRPGVYRIAISKPLDKGEYGFIYAITGGGGRMGAMSARVFDFSVS